MDMKLEESRKDSQLLLEEAKETSSEQDLEKGAPTTTFVAYERGERSGWWALRAVYAVAVLGILFTSLGVFLAAYKQYANTLVDLNGDPFIMEYNMPFRGAIVIKHRAEVVGLLFNVLITLCTELVGFIHGAALKSALASESRLHFNTNLRLFTAARKGSWLHPNGTLANGFMALLLAISYVSSSLLFLGGADFRNPYSKLPLVTVISAPPLIVLGTSLLLQSVIAAASTWSTHIQTYNTSPLNTAAALLDHHMLYRTSGQCMHTVIDASVYFGPRKPSRRQPSAWRSHSSIRKIIIFLWLLVPLTIIWGAVMWTSAGDSFHFSKWTLLPDGNAELRAPSALMVTFFSTRPSIWPVIFPLYVVTQGLITGGLHCTELIANTIRDETEWRQSTHAKGKTLHSNPLATLLLSWPSLTLLIAKPLIHWMFSLSLRVNCYVGGGVDIDEYVYGYFNIYPVQIFNLAIALSVFLVIFTMATLHCPSGPLPATYGHLQTIANLVDDWYLVMWWGHKETGPRVSHAGMSDKPLPPVNMDTWYAGKVCEEVSAISTTFARRSNVEGIARIRREDDCDIADLGCSTLI